MRRLVFLISVLLALFTACSGDSGTSDPGSSSAEGESTQAAGPDLPNCDDVWVVGQKLPEDYRGCVARDGEALASTYMNCGSGNGWGNEFLYWFEDGPLRYIAWSADKHDYPVEWDIEDGNVIGKASGVRTFDTAIETCREG